MEIIIDSLVNHVLKQMSTDHLEVEGVGSIGPRTADGSPLKLNLTYFINKSVWLNLDGLRLRDEDL